MNTSKSLSTELSKKFSCFMLIFILIVVLFHSDFRYYYPIINDLTTVSTSYFFCVSAFFFYRELEHKSIKSCLQKRGITLLLPFALWNIIYALLSAKEYTFTPLNILKGFTVDPFCTPSWYLMNLFIFFLIAPFVKCAFKKRSSTLLLLILGAFISYLGYIKFQQELASIPYIGGYLIRMATYLTAYLLGGIINTWFSHKLHVTWRTSVLGIFISCTLLLLLRYELSLEIRWLLWMTLPIAFWYSVPEIIFKHLTFSHFFTEPVFFLNMIHCCLLFQWVKVFENQTFITNICEQLTGKYLSALIVILTLATSYLLYYMLKLLLPEILQYLVGNRNNKQKGL